MRVIVRTPHTVVGVPLLFVSGPLNDVITVLDHEVADKAQLVSFQIGGAGVHPEARMLLIDESCETPVEHAKMRIPTFEIDRHFGQGFHAIAFLSALDGIRYASASSTLATRSGIDHVSALRALARVVFDENGRVRGSATEDSTLFLYTQRLMPRTDFAWDDAHFRRVPVELGGRCTIRHTVIGRRVVLAAAAGDNRLTAATADSIAAFVRDGEDPPFHAHCQVAGRVVDLALGVRLSDRAHGVIVSTDVSYISLAVSTDADATSIRADGRAPITIDSHMRDLGGVVRLSHDHAVFFGPTNVRFVPYAEIPSPYDAFFRSHAPTA